MRGDRGRGACGMEDFGWYFIYINAAMIGNVQTTDSCDRRSHIAVE